ncbi:MAG: WD40 repeat domain-containing protein [Hyphomicrobiales bacterium]
MTASRDKTARVFDAGSGRETAVLRGHEGIVQAAGFSPDGTRIVTASSDKTARIFDASTGREISALRGHEDKVNFAAFGPDGASIVTASADRTARIWGGSSDVASTEALLKDACTRKLSGATILSRDEMQLLAYPDDTPLIDACEGVR